MMPTPQQIDEMIERAAKKAVIEFELAHPCLLSSAERGLVRALHEIGAEEGANTGTWRIIIQTGRGWQDVTKRGRNMALALLFLIVLAAGLALAKNGYIGWFR